MKATLTLFALLLFYSSALAVNSNPMWRTQLATSPQISGVAAAMQTTSVEEFLALTPKQIRETTGERLGIKGSIALKMMQHSVQKQINGNARASAIPKIAYILLAFVPFGGAVVMGVLDEFNGNNWWIAGLLYFIAILPGIIFTLIKMDEYV